MFESGVRGAMLVLSLLVFGGGDAVRARQLATDLPGALCPVCGLMDASTSIGGVKTTDALALAGSTLFEPNAEAVPWAMRFPKALPGIAKPLVMVLVGLVFVSFVRDGNVWRAAAASVLSVGEHRLAGDPTLCDDASRGERRLVCSSLASKPRWVGPMKADFGFCSIRSRGVLRQDTGVAVTSMRPGIQDRLSRCLDSVADQVISLTSRWIFARLARGPPADA